MLGLHNMPQDASTSTSTHLQGEENYDYKRKENGEKQNKVMPRLCKCSQFIALERESEKK